MKKPPKPLTPKDLFLQFKSARNLQEEQKNEVRVLYEVTDSLLVELHRHYTYVDISEMTGIPASTLRNWASRYRQRQQNDLQTRESSTT